MPVLSLEPVSSAGDEKPCEKPTGNIVPPCPAVISVAQLPPRGLVTLQEITATCGICSTVTRDLVTFNKATFLNGRSLDVSDLSSVFWAGDWLNIIGASRFHTRERPDIPFMV